jgi:hypothetical protein
MKRKINIMIYEDNILYVDIEKFEHVLTIYNKTSPRIRLYLGIIQLDEFEVTIDTIKNLPDELQSKLRNYIRSIFNI